jgi:hypothetical protein
VAILITVMPQKRYHSKDLKPGLLIRDVQTGDLGLLVDRFNIFEHYGDHDPLWVWNMTWTGPATDDYNRNTPYLEEAVLGLINGSTWEIRGNDSP